MLFGLSNKKEANEKYITLCKASESLIKIDYLDSTHGISEIKSSTKNDTLELKVYVSTHQEQKSFDIPIERNIKYLKIGGKIFDLSKASKCVNIYSGKDAIDKIK
jgi:hypothetical protein